MSTFTNSVDPDAMPHYALFVKVKKKLVRQKNTVFFENYILTP